MRPLPGTTDKSGTQNFLVFEHVPESPEELLYWFFLASVERFLLCLFVRTCNDDERLRWLSLRFSRQLHAHLFVMLWLTLLLPQASNIQRFPLRLPLWGTSSAFTSSTCSRGWSLTAAFRHLLNDKAWFCAFRTQDLDLLLKGFTFSCCGLACSPSTVGFDRRFRRRSVNLLSSGFLFVSASTGSNQEKNQAFCFSVPTKASGAGIQGSKNDEIV